MQSVVTAVVVLLAAAYVARAGVLTVRSALDRGSGCGSGCGRCAAQPVAETPESRRRIPLL